MRRMIPCLIACMLLAACAAGPTTTYGPVRDTQRLSQNPMDYVQPELAEAPIIPAQVEDGLAVALARRFYAPWDAREPLHAADKVFHILELYANQTTWGENLRPHERNWLAGLASKANPETFPNADFKAVTVTAASLRVLPTHRPMFKNPDKAGEGFPFDYMQNALLPPGAPIHVTHVSRDKAWMLVETEELYGWLPIRDIALVDDRFERSYRSEKLWAPLFDGEPVLGPDGVARFTTRLGMLLPLAGMDGKSAVVVAPAAGFDGRAVPVLSKLDADGGGQAPIPLTEANLARAAAGIMGKPYGWAGLFESRDCSATLQDLFLPFGVILPRNSLRQIQDGPVADLRGLSPEAKREIIAKNGRPWITLLYRPGHIVLYLGVKEGEPVVLQTMWGVKTRDRLGREGRHVVGETVITSLSPGRELDRMAEPEGDLLQALTGMRMLVGPPESGGASSQKTP